MEQQKVTFDFLSAPEPPCCMLPLPPLPPRRPRERSLWEGPSPPPSPSRGSLLSERWPPPRWPPLLSRPDPVLCEGRPANPSSVSRSPWCGADCLSFTTRLSCKCEQRSESDLQLLIHMSYVRSSALKCKPTLFYSRLIRTYCPYWKHWEPFLNS